jgi:hypothetical protein
MNTAIPLLLFAIAGILAVVLFACRNWQSQTVLEQWAEKNRFELLVSEHRPVFHGPFPAVTSIGLTVYRVKVRTHEGAVRFGWVRCGALMWGWMGDRLDVRWDGDV